MLRKEEIEEGSKVKRAIKQSHEKYQLVKTDLNKKLDPKQKTIQACNIDAQRFRKTKNENPTMREIGVAS